MRLTRSLACVPVLTALALTAGCGRQSELATTAAATETPGATGQTGHPAPSLEEAIALIRLATHWPRSTNQAESQRVQHRLLGRHELPQSTGEQRRLLIYASRAAVHDCNACSPDLSFFEFQLDPPDQSPRLVMASLAAVSLGYAGEDPHARVQALGGDRYAIMLNWEEFAQGRSSLLSVLTPVEGRMREVFLDEVGGQHDLVTLSGELAEIEWETDIRFLPGPVPYRDLHLQRRFITGKRWLIDPVQSPLASPLTAQGKVPSEMVYRFNGHGMQLVWSR